MEDHTELTHDPLKNHSLFPCQPHLPTQWLWPTASHTNSRSASVTCRKQDWPSFPIQALPSLPSPHLEALFSSSSADLSLPKVNHCWKTIITCSWTKWCHLHSVWGIKGREISGRGEPFQSASVFTPRKFLKGWLLSPSSFPRVLEEGSPWPDAEGCGSKVSCPLSPPLQMTKSTPRKRGTDIGKRLISYCSLFSFTIKTSFPESHPFLTQQHSSQGPDQVWVRHYRFPRWGNCTSETLIWNHKNKFLLKPCNRVHTFYSIHQAHFRSNIFLFNPWGFTWKLWCVLLFTVV